MSFLSTTLRAGGRGEILQIGGVCREKFDSRRERSKNYIIRITGRMFRRGMGIPKESGGEILKRWTVRGLYDLLIGSPGDHLT
jgi:hypothetical protein